MNKMYYLSLTLLTAVMAAISVAAMTKDEMRQAAIKFANFHNKNLPKQIDNVTTLSRIYADGLEVHFVHTTAQKYSVTDPSVARREIIESICKNWSEVINMGVSFVYDYQTQSGQTYFSVAADRC